MIVRRNMHKTTLYLSFIINEDMKMVVEQSMVRDVIFFFYDDCKIRLSAKNKMETILLFPINPVGHLTFVPQLIKINKKK